MVSVFVHKYIVIDWAFSDWKLAVIVDLEENHISIELKFNSSLKIADMKVDDKTLKKSIFNHLVLLLIWMF